jgi:tetratricopeptide (TPR) repeat protein
MNEQTQITMDKALELHSGGDLSGAGEAYARLLDLEPNNHDARYGLGTVLMQQGDLEAAIGLLEQAVSEAPGVPEYRFNLGCALQQVDQHFSAIEQFRAALVQRPNARAVLLALARSLASTRNYPAAVQAQEQALSIEASSAADFLTYGDLLFSAKRPEDARRAVGNARQLGSKDAQGYFLEARCEQLAGNSDAERELLRQAIDIRPGYGDAWQRLLELTPDDEILALADDCEALFGDAATAKRDKIVLRYTVGRAYERMGEFAQAITYFDDANCRQREDAEARGKGYVREDNDRFLAWARDEYDGQGTTASRVSVDEQPVFIVGMPRSGTTLVESILGGLEGISIGGESEALEFATTQYYNALASGQSPAVRQLEQHHWDELADLYWRIQTGSKSRLTDKMPTNFRHVGMLCRMFPDAPVIFVRRDPRDVAMSIYTRMFPDGHAYATDLENIAHYYGIAEKLRAHWQQLYPERIMTIDLETLINEPEQESRRLADFCGIEWQASCLDFHERQRASYTFSEMQVREPINTKGIGKWRNYSESMAPFVDACVANGVKLQDS